MWRCRTTSSSTTQGQSEFGLVVAYTSKRAVLTLTWVFPRRLEGNFARIEHQRALMTRRVAPQVITSLSYILPPRVRNPYYYDLVGNVSTSNFRSSEPTPGQVRLPSAAAGRSSVLELRPRYPLMGGWNFTYTVGYDGPLEDSVRRRDVEGRRGYVLRVPFLTAIKDVAADAVELSIRLPEGAK